ncbi:hypothetical protein D3C86_2078600 [compost metagenome]
MHHSSVESQEVYTQVNARETLVELEAAAQRLRSTYPSIRPVSDLLLPVIELND